MTQLPLGVNAYDRSYAQQPEIKCINRFFERNPTNLTDGVSRLARPATSQLVTMGVGRPRGFFTQKGSFGGDLFAVIGAKLYRYTTDGQKIEIDGDLDISGDVSMAATGGRLFVTDGSDLQFYAGSETSATNILSFTGNAANDETVVLGSVTYTFKTTLTGAANEVLIGIDETASMRNLIEAINDGTGEGVVYGTGTVQNPDASASETTVTTMTVTAREPGLDGNSIATTETISNASWASPTLSGGSNGGLTKVDPPNTESFVSVAVLAQYVIVVVANSQKWFFIRPGTTMIQALDFYEAEQMPDEIISARTVGDQVFFFGEESSEPWYANGAGNADDPFSRSQGAAFSRGILEGTDVRLKESLIVVGDDNVVYDISGGIRPISNSFISEKIRLAREAEAAS